MSTKKTQKTENKFVCENCDFKSVNKFDYKRHLSTVKHKSNALTTEFNAEMDKNSKNTSRIQ